MYFVVLRPREVRALGLAPAEERELLREVLRRMGWRVHTMCAALAACGLVQFLVLALLSGEGLPHAVRLALALGGVVTLVSAGQVFGEVHAVKLRALLEERRAGTTDQQR